jgi:hypothetical protein
LRVERWSARQDASGAEVLACEESLVEGCAILMARYGTAPLSCEAAGDVRQVRDRLADDPLNPPTLSDMAKMAGLSRYQVLRRFESVYGLPPHAWLLHINFGYPLLDEGSRFVYEAEKVEPRQDPLSQRHFVKSNDYRTMPGPGTTEGPEVVAYIYPKAGPDGRATVGIFNKKLPLRLTFDNSTEQFPRCGNWQRCAEHEYVAALEPMNGTVDGRDQDRASQQHHLDQAMCLAAGGLNSAPRFS